MNHFKIGLVLAALISGPASALDFIVDSTLDVEEESPGNGVCNPVGAIGSTCTLRAAIMEANANPGPHNILLPSGTYLLDNIGIGEDDAATGDLDIHEEITIINGAATAPVIFGGYDDRVFDIHADGDLTLDHVNVAGGSANFSGTTRGGAINVQADAQLHLKRSEVSSNIGNIGGAIYSDGLVQIEDSEFYNNVITDDEVLPEFADGTAILNRGVLIVNRSTFRANGVIPGGEGQFLDGEYAVQSRAGFVTNPVVMIFNSTFHDNTNGIFSDGVPTQITQSTIVNNNQRGIRFLLDLDNLGDVQLLVERSVVYGHASDCNDLTEGFPEYDLAFNINASSDESCGFTGFNDYQNIGNPFNGPAGDHGGPTTTFMPRSNGVLVDPVGSQCGGTDQDQRGTPRPIDGNDSGVALCDIGSVEYNPDTDPEFTDSLFSDRFEQN